VDRMPRVAKALNDRQVRALAHPQTHERDGERRVKDKIVRWKAGDPITTPARFNVGGDPPGLMVQVTRTGSKSWVLRTADASGKRREVGLGSYPTVSLAKAREMATEYVAGRDPKAATRRGNDKAITFRECAQRYLTENAEAWSNSKHAAQWESTLNTWAYPKLGRIAVRSIDKIAIKDVLMQPVEAAGGKPFWIARAETARRVRQRIETILGWAKAHDHMEGENPARLKDNLDVLLPKLSKAARKVKHHTAIPYSDVPTFMASLRTRGGDAAQALAFLIYTAARSGEVRGADWSEIDLDRAMWIVPGERMKGGREHSVALSGPALEILEAIPDHKRSGLIWPGGAGKPLSDMTLSAVLKRMAVPVTVHGFRSTFRDWAGECTNHERQTIEHALAHSLPDEVEAAYARGTHFQKRVRLMSEWAAFLNGDAGADVIPLHGAAG